MSAQITEAALARAQTRYDGESAPEPQSWEPWTPMTVPRATVQQLQDFIEHLADTGYYEDEFGNSKQAGEIYQAIAIDWMDNKMKLPAHTYLAFERWAMAACNLSLRAA